jgi:GntR family transcriptional regulator
MRLSINRESSVPLHDQLVTQISLLIASGVLAPGQRLPSVRDLANRLDIHRNTVSAVYKTLESHGVVTVKMGSGVRVIDLKREPSSGGWREGVALRHLAAKFVEDARERGYTDEAIAEAVDLALRPEGIRRVVVADPHEDFHPIYLHELSRALSFPLEARTLDAIEADGAPAYEDAALLTSTYHLTPLQEILGGERRVGVFHVNAADQLLGQIKALPTGTNLGLVSVSDTLMRMSREVIAGLRGEDLLLLETHPDDEERLRSLTRLSDVIITDSPSYEPTRRLTAKPIFQFQLIPDASIQSLAQQLPPEAFLTGLTSMIPGMGKVQ